jgi:uncharacterized protein (UPF0548 family)
VFSLNKPTAAAINESLAAASQSYFLALQTGLKPSRLPFAFVHDFSRTLLGNGEPDFKRAKLAFRQWVPFDLGWVSVVNPTAPITVGQIVAVQAHTLGLWSLNLSRIVEVLDTPTSFGFLYATTPFHIEEGEERFLLTLDPENGNLWYELEAVSRPHNPLALLGLPITRHFQRRFARESHCRIAKVVSSPPGLSCAEN